MIYLYSRSQKKRVVKEDCIERFQSPLPPICVVFNDIPEKLFREKRFLVNKKVVLIRNNLVDSK